LRFVVEFTRMDLRRPRDRQRALLGWRLILSPEASLSETGLAVTPGVVRGWRPSAKSAGPLQRELSWFFAEVAESRGTGLPSFSCRSLIFSLVQRPDWERIRNLWGSRGAWAKAISLDGPVAVFVHGSMRDVARYYVLRLLERVGASNLKVCSSTLRGKRCGRLFVKIKRQEYCSETCQQRENQRRWRADNPGRLSTPRKRN
jgi:hypothetical protein